MEWSATTLNLPFPHDLDFKTVCHELLQKNGLKDARLKIVLSQRQNDDCFGHQQSFDSDEQGQPHLVIYALPFDPQKTSHPGKLKIIKTFCNDALPFAAMKTTNYLTKIWGRKEAQEAGFDDAVLLNTKGYVTETCSANLFWVDADNKLFTVPEDQGLLSGVIRNAVMALLAEHKIRVKEALITAQQLSHAREIFVTNSLVGVRAMVAVDGRQISGGETGSVTAMIQDLWQKHLQQKYKAF